MGTGPGPAGAAGLMEATSKVTGACALWANKPQTIPSIAKRAGLILVLRGLFDAIDHDHVDRAFLLFQAQAKLLLDGGEQCRTIGIGWRRWLHAGRQWRQRQR